MGSKMKQDKKAPIREPFLSWKRSSAEGEETGRTALENARDPCI